MRNILMVLPVGLALIFTPAAQATDTKNGNSSDCPRGKSACPHPSVAEGLKAIEGTRTRYQAEICQMLYPSQQEDCMAAIPQETRDSDLAKRKDPEGWKASAPVDEIDGPSRGRGAHHELCREEWGNNYSMREYCDKQQNAARRRGGY